jgi:hypothetical protein
MPAQRLLIMALKSQIQTWRVACQQPDISDDDAADMQNDIGYAFGVLSDLEENFFQQFGQHPE